MTCISELVYFSQLSCMLTRTVAKIPQTAASVPQTFPDQQRSDWSTADVTCGIYTAETATHSYFWSVAACMCIDPATG
jgi:hypothetical protein